MSVSYAVIGIKLPTNDCGGWAKKHIIMKTNCDHKFPKKAKFCPECGTPRAEIKCEVSQSDYFYYEDMEKMAKKFCLKVCTDTDSRNVYVGSIAHADDDDWIIHNAVEPVLKNIELLIEALRKNKKAKFVFDEKDLKEYYNSFGIYAVQNCSY